MRTATERRYGGLRIVEPIALPLDEHLFDDGASLADALAKAVAADLRGAIARRGSARIALSGGSTPRAFLTALSKQTVDWPHVTVLPVDDRWVHPRHERSNEKLMRETLLQGAAAAARFMPLYRPSPSPEAALLPVLSRVANEALPLDVVVLGMGEDGHVASLFPDLGRDSPGLREIGLQPSGRAPALAVRTANAPEPRMTLTLSAIFTAPSLYLHIEGAKKKAVLEGAAADPTSLLPVRAVLAGAPRPPSLYWCP
ncbi:6-phosphogluconolactonase [Lysobacter sp. SG-8]|uniref:6-phosphogluconolactonase n=1 Tax=Marilutibacter penaei TaxID=2759900 RepID=A0A7W3U1T1_9GAMM|nr:6-phosphogluconolactonase [Lysobacter penaei]MBB1087328.1 6-phosphogluconolactonase [Lysobacter penaei]